MKNLSFTLLLLSITINLCLAQVGTKDNPTVQPIPTVAQDDTLPPPVSPTIELEQMLGKEILVVLMLT